MDRNSNDRHRKSRNSLLNVDVDFEQMLKNKEQLLQNETYRLKWAEPIIVNIEKEMKEVIDSLPDRSKDILIQRFIEKKPLADIGERYGITREAIRIRLKEIFENFEKETNNTISVKTQIFMLVDKIESAFDSDEKVFVDMQNGELSLYFNDPLCKEIFVSIVYAKKNSIFVFSKKENVLCKLPLTLTLKVYTDMLKAHRMFGIPMGLDKMIDITIKSGYSLDILNYLLLYMKATDQHKREIKLYEIPDLEKTKGKGIIVSYFKKLSVRQNLGYYVNNMGEGVYDIAEIYAYFEKAFSGGKSRALPKFVGFDAYFDNYLDRIALLDKHKIARIDWVIQQIGQGAIEKIQDRAYRFAISRYKINRRPIFSLSAFVEKNPSLAELVKPFEFTPQLVKSLLKVGKGKDIFRNSKGLSMEVLNELKN